MSDESIDRRLREVENRRQQLREGRSTPQTPSPKIQKVARHLRERKDFDKHYKPTLVSFGPIHHGAEDLQVGEQYKLMWTAMYLNSTGRSAKDLHKNIAENIDELKDLFDEDLFNTEEFTDYESQDFQNINEKLSWMLFVDGCSLLHILDNGNLGKDFNYNKLNLKIDQLILVRQDVLLLENQLPFPLLRRLCRHGNPNAELVKSMDKFLHSHHLWPDHKSEPANPAVDSQPEHRLTIPPLKPPVHLLDYLHSTILDDPPSNEPHNTHKTHGSGGRSNKEAPKLNPDPEITHRNLQELQAKGIKLKKIPSFRPKMVKFSPGIYNAKLELPRITVDDTTATTFHNLIAYEMCPDFQNDYEISSFVAFLDSLVDRPEDVKHLRSAGILRNALGSDEEVSTLFNTISRDLVTEEGSYSEVRIAIQRHCDNTWKAWWAEGMSIYFSSPWSAIALIGAIIGLVLTLIQTLQKN